MSDINKTEEGPDEGVNHSLQELLLKQQALLLQQSDFISKVNIRKKEEADEIDLSILVPRFLKKRKNADGPASDDEKIEVGFIGEQFNIIYENRVLLTLFLAFGMLYSVFQHYASPKVYKSTMTVASGFFDNTYYASLLYPLENLSQSNSWEGLAKTLQLDTSITKKLVNIKYRDFLSKDESDFSNDSTLAVINRPYFKIEVVISDNAILSELQDGIFNYMNNNKYVKKQLIIRKLTLTRSVEELKKEANWLDTLKTAIVTSLNYNTTRNRPINYTIKDSEQRPGEVVLSREEKIKVEAVDLFSKSQMLGNDIISTEAELLQLQDNLQIVGNFSANSARLSLTTQNIVLISVYALLLGLVFIYVRGALVRYLKTLKRA